MAINSRAKGAAGERELAGLIQDWAGVRLVRNLEQVRNGGHDLIVHPDETGPVADAFRCLAIEIKRHAEAKPAQIMGWWQQAVNQASVARKLPVLAYRANRRDWRVIVPLSMINRNLSTNPALINTAEVSVEAFCSIVREVTP